MLVRGVSSAGRRGCRGGREGKIDISAEWLVSPLIRGPYE
jgi:hypothetical protein